MNVTDLKNGTFFMESGNTFQVLIYEHNKTGRGSGNIKLKVRNLKTGTLTEKTFITGAKVEEANVEKKKAQYLYKDGNTLNFMDPVSFEQFSLDQAVVGEAAKFLKDGMDLVLITSAPIQSGSGDEALAMELPLSLVYTISETGPGERGNSVSNVFKEATLDNGLVIRVPMFIGVGEKVKVDTRTGQYVERVK